MLYLRSFGDDRLRMRTGGAHRHDLAERIRPVRRELVEELVVDKLWRYGPVVAVSEPGGAQPPIGAAREQLPDHEWRAAIEERMTAAALIVVIIGRTQGLAWEVETLARLGLLTKVLWVFPPVDVGELERRWAATLRLLVNEVGPGLTLGAEPGAVLMARVHDNTELVAYIGDRRDEWASDRPPRLARRWRSRSAPTSCSVPTAIGPRLRRAGACSPTSSPTLSSSARGSLPGGSSGRPPGPRRLPPLPFPVSPTRTWVLGVPATNVLRHGGAPPGPVVMCNGMFNLDNQPASDLSFLGIVARFELRGEDATADNAAKIRATISKHCNAVFSGIGLVTLVTVDVGDPATPVAPDRGVIELFRTPADGRSTIERFGPGMPPEPQDRDEPQRLGRQLDAGARVRPLHRARRPVEDVPTAAGGVTSVPNPGWEGTIMAQTNGVGSIGDLVLLCPGGQTGRWCDGAERHLLI